MSTIRSSGLGARLLVAAAIVVGLMVALPSIAAHAAGSGQIGVSGLSTCSDGSQSFGGCGGTGIGYCGGALVSGLACSGPGIKTTSPGCTGTVCVPVASNGGSVRSGQAYRGAIGSASAGPGLPASASNGTYCTISADETIWVPSGASPDAMGCSG